MTSPTVRYGPTYVRVILIALVVAGLTTWLLTRWVLIFTPSEPPVISSPVTENYDRAGAVGTVTFWTHLEADGSASVTAVGQPGCVSTVPSVAGSQACADTDPHGSVIAYLVQPHSHRVTLPTSNGEMPMTVLHPTGWNLDLAVLVSVRPLVPVGKPAVR